MLNLILVTGGARSGKSTLGEKITKDIGENIVYIATAIAFDDSMKDRIKKHRNSRPKEWTTIEKYRSFNTLESNQDFLDADTIILDCMTIMISNLILESGYDFYKITMEEVDKLEEEIFNEIDSLLKIMEDYNKNFVVVTNEVGMGLVPSYKLGSIFRDIAGRGNQYLAKKATEVHLTVSGIPLKIK